MPAKLDRAANSVVVTCPDCPAFREVRGDVITAGRVKADHDRREHDSSSGERSLKAALRRRQALR